MKTAVIAGASGGIGSALCQRLNSSGWRIALLGRNAEKMEILKSTLKDAQVFLADVTKSEQIQSAFEEITEKMGAPLAVAHCVGSILLKPAHQLRDEEWLETLNINLNSAFYLLRSAVKLWTRTQTAGSLVFCSTAAAKIGLANHEAVGAAKAGLEGLIRSAAASYASRGIRVNGVAPGLVQTELSARITNSEAALKASLALHPMKKLGQSSDIASALAWFMDPEQSWVTGQILGVDGGLGSLKTLVPSS